MFYTNGAVNTLKFSVDKNGKNVAYLYNYASMRFVRVNFAQAEAVVFASDLAWELAA
jgi:hypothetical protein